MLDNIEQIKSFERQLIFLLNLDGWALQWTGEGYESFDADGYDDSGNTCVLELKFRKKAYRLKMLEKYKYDKEYSCSDNWVLVQKLEKKNS